MRSSSSSYKKISTLLTYIEGGNMSTTALSIVCLTDAIFYESSCLQALIDGKATKLLLNIIEADSYLCVRRSRFAALRCLGKFWGNRVLQKDLLTFRGIQLLLKCLNPTDHELMLEAIYLIADICTDSSSWETARICGGIQTFISLLNAHESKVVTTSLASKSEILKLKLTIAQYSAKSLSLLCADDENRKVACTTNIINACQFWIRSKHQQVTVPILILLQYLSLSITFRKKVNDSLMIFDVLHHLRSLNMELKQAAADLIFICAGDQNTFKCFYKQEFLFEILQMLSNLEFHENEIFMTSISGIIWKCSKRSMCVKQLEALNVMPVFIQLLGSQPVQVKAYLVGTIGMCFSSLILREMLKKNGGIEIMVNFLQTTHLPLLINLNETLAKCSEDPEILIQYQQLDTVQLIWACLKNADFQVQSSAASALHTILRNMKKADLQIDNSLDGIECIIDLLKSRKKELLISACTLIHNLAKEKNALSVLVEFDVASHLMKLMRTKDKKLLQQLCLAVSSCCSFKKGCERFASCGITRSLLKHLKARNKLLRVTAASALSKIASLPNWCPETSQNEILPILTEMLLDTKNEDGNESAAIIIRNILCNIEQTKTEPITEP